MRSGSLAPSSRTLVLGDRTKTRGAITPRQARQVDGKQEYVVLKCLHEPERLVEVPRLGYALEV